MRKADKIEGGFIVIPKRTILCNNWAAINSSARDVYITMLTKFIRSKKDNPEYKVKITQKQIETITGLSHATVWRSLKQLKQNGFILVEPDEQGGLERNYTTYRLVGKFLY